MEHLYLFACPTGMCLDAKQIYCDFSITIMCLVMHSTSRQKALCGTSHGAHVAGGVLQGVERQHLQ